VILNAMANTQSKVFYESDAQTAIVKLCLLIMWILDSTQRINQFAEYCDLKLDYNINT
jgi:hypothetical protein